MRADKISSGISGKMASMSFVCACLVVFFHTTTYPDIGTLDYWVEAFIGKYGIPRCAVPWFFFAAGFFLSTHSLESGWWKCEVAKRVRTLLVPLFIWHFIYDIFYLMMRFVARSLSINAGQSSGGAVLDSILLSLTIHPFINIGPLWVLRTLFIFVVLSPLVFFLNRKGRMVWIAILALLYVLFATVGPQNGPWWNFFELFMSIRGLFYFSLGAYIRLNHLRFRWNPLIFPAAIVLLFCRAWCSIHCAFWDRLLGVVMEPVILLSLYVVMPMRFPTGFNDVRTMSFPIYLMHTLFILMSGALFYPFGIRSSISQSCLVGISKAAFAIGASAAATYMIRKCLPMYFSKLLFGGR